MKKSLSDKSEKAIIVGVAYKEISKKEMFRSLEELRDLIATAGGLVIKEIYQDIKRIDPATFIGKGKVLEIKNLIKEYNANVVIIDEDLSPIQNRNLEQQLDVFVLDRTAIILDIFAKRARTKEGKLQVELAQLEYLAPRLVGRGKMFSQQVGRIGTRGPGETQLEKDRRRIKERITLLKNNIEKVKQTRGIYREKRQAVPVPLVAIVGYTNAGKSTLMNYLTNSNIFVEDKLFATLDPTVRKIKLPSARQILLVDTVGFIRRLPHELVASFKATFEEISYANLILHVIDASDPDYPTHIKVVNEVLSEMKLNFKPKIVVFNKCDINKDIIDKQDSVHISALNGLGVNNLLERISQDLNKAFNRVKLRVPHNRGDVLSIVYKIGHVFKSTHKNTYVMLDCVLPEKYEKKYKEYIK